VCEWCSDWYGKDYYSSGAAADPAGPSSGSLRILRGGSWNAESRNCRSPSRNSSDPAAVQAYLGFRVAAGISQATAPGAPSEPEGLGRIIPLGGLRWTAEEGVVLGRGGEGQLIIDPEVAGGGIKSGLITGNFRFSAEVRNTVEPLGYTVLAIETREKYEMGLGMLQNKSVRFVDHAITHTTTGRHGKQEDARFGMRLNKWYKIEVARVGDELRWYLDGERGWVAKYPLVKGRARIRLYAHRGREGYPFECRNMEFSRRPKP